VSRSDLAGYLLAWLMVPSLRTLVPLLAKVLLRVVFDAVPLYFLKLK
jgi:hypothetical protein